MRTSGSLTQTILACDFPNRNTVRFSHNYLSGKLLYSHDSYDPSSGLASPTPMTTRWSRARVAAT